MGKEIVMGGLPSSGPVDTASTFGIGTYDSKIDDGNVRSGDNEFQFSELPGADIVRSDPESYTSYEWESESPDTSDSSFNEIVRTVDRKNPSHPQPDDDSLYWKNETEQDRMYQGGNSLSGYTVQDQNDDNQGFPNLDDPYKNRTVVSMKKRQATNFVLVNELCDEFLKDKYTNITKRHVLRFLSIKGQPQYLSSDMIRCLNERKNLAIKDVLGEFNASDELARNAIPVELLENQENVSVSDFTWANIGDEYYEQEAIPRQNLDMVPELVRNLMVEDGMPVRFMSEKSMNDVRYAEPVDVSDSVKDHILDVVHRYAMAKYPKDLVIKNLNDHFHKDQIKIATSGIKKIRDEWDLIGNVYVDSNRFGKKCYKNKEQKQIVASHAKRALFIIKNDKCEGCSANVNGECMYYGKHIVDEVPYNRKTLAAYSLQLKKEGRTPDVKSKDIKQSLKIAFKKPVVSKVNNNNAAVHPTVMKENTGEKVIQAIRKIRDRKMEKRVSSEYLHAANQIHKGILVDLSGATDPDVKQLKSEIGVMGDVYIDIDALGGCDKAMSHVIKNKITPKYAIRRQSECPICHGEPGGGCDQLSKISTIVNDIPKLYRSDVITVASRLIKSGKLDKDGLMKAASIFEKEGAKSAISAMKKFGPIERPTSVVNQTQVVGQQSLNHSNSVVLDPDQVFNFVSHLMNTGLYGKDLIDAILKKYSLNDVKSVNAIKKLLKYDGVQGYYFIDPTVYPDYGGGCKEGSTLFKRNDVPNVMSGDACVGCTHHSRPGWCNRYGKSLINDFDPSSTGVENMNDIDAEKSAIKIQVSSVDPSQEAQLQKLTLETMIDVMKIVK